MPTEIFPYRRPSAWVCTALLSAALGSCDGESRPDPPDDGPAAAESEAFGFSERIALVRDLTVLPSGEVWVLNSVEPLFIGFAPDGSVSSEHGRFGGGPTEFGAPTAFVSGNIDGQAWVFDAERHTLIEISGATADRREIALPSDGSLPPTHLFGGRELIGAGARTARLGEEVVFALNAPAMAGGMLSFWRAIWTADLVSLDPATGSVRELISLADVLGSPDEGFSLSGRDMSSAVDYLAGHDAVTGAGGDGGIGVMGFCMGGLLTFVLASLRPDKIKAAVPFYGFPTGDGQPDYSAITAAIQGHMAENDDFFPPSAAHELEGRLQAMGKDVTLTVHPGTGHAFMAPHNALGTQDAELAATIWPQATAFLHEHLS